MAKGVVFTIKDIVEICRQRQQNELDCIIAFTGNRGNGKSSCAFRIGKRFPSFNNNPKKFIIYTRKEGLPLLESTKYGFIMDDEAIRSSYKRNFQDTDQKLLIQMLNMYRDNFNIYALCIPKFYALDKDLRDLIKIHIHVVQRGLAIVHVAREDVLYSDDVWDVAYNKKIEERWNEHKKNNPNFIPPYHKLTTFVGYLKIPKLKPKDQERYKKIKFLKRKKVFDSEMQTVSPRGEKSILYDRLYEAIKNKQVTKKLLQQFCIINGLSFTSTMTVMQKRSRDEGIELKTVLIDDLNVKPEKKLIKKALIY